MIGPQALTIDGVEAQFGTNFLGHFLLSNRIAKLIKPSGRIARVSSAGHRRSDVDLKDPNFTHTPYNEYLAYGRSKTAMILLAVELDRRLRAKSIRATALHPSAIQTETVQKIIDSLENGKKQRLHPSNGKLFPKGQQQPSGRESSRRPPRWQLGTAKTAMLLTSWTMPNRRPAFVPMLLTLKQPRHCGHWGKRWSGNASPYWTHEQVDPSKECCSLLLDGIRV